MLRTGSSLGAALQEHHHGAQITLDEEPPHVSQALYRTQPEPAAHGRRRTMTHDYKRHCITTLFAALPVTTGKVIGQCMSRQRYREWLRFLRRIDAETPRHLDVHLITDNYATHKHAWVPASAVPHAFHPDLDAAPTRLLFAVASRRVQPHHDHPLRSSDNRPAPPHFHS